MTDKDQYEEPYLLPRARARMIALARGTNRRCGDRRGVIVNQGSPSSWRVKFDKRAAVQAIHRDYLEPAPVAAGTDRPSIMWDHGGATSQGSTARTGTNMSRTCRRLLTFLVGFPLLLAVAGCASMPRTQYTGADSASVRILGRDDLRRYSDSPASAFRNRDSAMRGRRTYLALSGGGADGAYGAGLLNGWTEAGSRPSFSIVSGVSTGALIAPFAYLGSQYDPTLRELYTGGIAASLLDSPNPLNAIFGSGLFGNRRLRELVAHYIDANFVATVANEYAKGRLLFVVTTNLDSQRTAIWDMGRIASLGTPASLALFRDVVAASASLPAVFPPILIDAEANGRRVQEMHVDGGVTAPVLALPETFLRRGSQLGRAADLQLFILMNNKIEPEFQVVNDKTIDIASRASSTMVKAQTRSILRSTYEFARNNKFDFNVTYVEGDRPPSPSTGFDTGYMRELFQYGYDKARGSHLWAKSPPSESSDGAVIAAAPPRQRR